MEFNQRCDKQIYSFIVKKGEGIMETIKTYLENMFMHFPMTAEVKRAKEELYTMMEDKYNELKVAGTSENEAIGIVISEFGNMDEVAEDLGLLHYNESNVKEEVLSVVSMKEAKDYISDTIHTSHKIALGVMLCICSPIALIILFGMEELELYGMTEAVAGTIGVFSLLIMVAVAVGIFIFHGMKLEKYAKFEKEAFQLESGLETYVKQEKEGYLPKFAVKITIGVSLCILGIFPVILAGLAFEDTLFMFLSVGLLLFMISIGVYFLITGGMRQETYGVLLQEGEYTKYNKKGSKLTETVASIYWPLVVVIYLGWSLTSNAWGRTWVVWPIAGILFAVVANICNAVSNEKTV